MQPRPDPGHFLIIQWFITTLNGRKVRVSQVNLSARKKSDVADKIVGKSCERQRQSVPLS